jgi:hypothetical protein
MLPECLRYISLAAVTVLVTACDGGVYLNGQVVDGNGEPVRNARVLLLIEGRVRAERDVDTRGCFELSETVAPGRYTFQGEVTAPGFNSATVEVPTLERNSIRVKMARASQGPSSVILGHVLACNSEP